MSKLNIINQILSLMKENGITNKEILQSNMSGDNKNNLTTISLLTKNDYEKYKNTYLKLPGGFTLTGTRYYFIGSISAIYGNKAPDPSITGSANTTNINKLGYDIDSGVNLTDRINGTERNGNTYYLFDRMIIQNNNSNGYIPLFSTNYNFKAGQNTYNFYQVNFSIGTVSKSSNQPSFNKVNDSSWNHHIHITYRMQFLPIFKV